MPLCPYCLKCERRRQQVAGLALRPQIAGRHRLAVILASASAWDRTCPPATGRRSGTGRSRAWLWPGNAALAAPADRPLVCAPATPPNPTMPNPAPIVCSSSRRVIFNSPTRIRWSSSSTRAYSVHLLFAANARPSCDSSADGARPNNSRYACRTRSASWPLSRLASPAACVFHKAAVHQKQPLQRHVGHHALLAGAVRIGEIEQRQHRVQLAPADEPVDRAPLVLLVELHRRTARLSDPDCPRRTTANRAASPHPALPVGAPQQPVVRVHRAVGRDIFGTERVHRGQHDLAMQRLHRPPALHQAAPPGNPAAPGSRAAPRCCRNCSASPRCRVRNDAARCGSPSRARSADSPGPRSPPPVPAVRCPW